MKKLILASTSPYRKELLERLCIPFECVDSKVDEDLYKKEISSPLELTKTLAYEKAQSVFAHSPQSYVIGGDQICLFENKILGKPGGYKNAFEQLRSMQSKEHNLITSVCLLGPDGYRQDFTDNTKMKMRSLTNEEISRYLKKDEPYDCAGAYKIESIGISLFEAIISKDSTGIIGLPLIQLSHHLRERGFEIP